MHGSEDNGMISVMCWKRKQCQTRILYKTNRYLKNESKIKSFSDQSNAEFITSRAALCEILTKIP